MQRAPRPCPVPGCPNLVVKAGGCAAHQNAQHATRHAGGASKAWQAFAAAWLKAHPWCAYCGVAPARQVHHKIAVRAAPELRFSPRNVVGVCHTCHARAHVDLRATTNQTRRRSR